MNHLDIMEAAEPSVCFLLSTCLKINKKIIPVNKLLIFAPGRGRQSTAEPAERWHGGPEVWPCISPVVWPGGYSVCLWSPEGTAGWEGLAAAADHGRSLKRMAMGRRLSGVNNLPVNAGDTIQSLGREEMVTHTNILAWRIPWTEELGGDSPWGCNRVEHN